MKYEKVADAFKDQAFKFKREEFVHPQHVGAVGLENCTWFISLFQVNYAALLRETLQAPVILNTWHVTASGPGCYVGRGTRPRGYKPKGGGELSMHYLAMALDVVSPAFTPSQIFNAILRNEAKFKAIGLTTVEDLNSTPGWLHGDGRQVTASDALLPGFKIVNAPSK